MKDKQDIIERTMGALDDIKPISAPLGFEQRFMEKLESQNHWQRYFRMAVAAMVIFALANVFTVFQLTNDTSRDSYLDESYFADSTYPILNFTEDE
ncbi:MAG: hypothetical protein CMB80_19130 [Flammeovirgaceae bacterium]|nr:hypothetical protein [Flammeovirgaceae bacterium]MBR07761.1 hypothetical protein [Rickettsiales bacterium]|tara:strand:+ start:1137 stop:1424 length:288 start_codon:yes stop_codon:yes gene_type:complete